MVSQVGPEVTSLKVGDRVCVDPNMYCGHCRACRKGQVHFCENMIGYGTTLYGGFAEQCRVLEHAAYKIPDSLSFEHAALVEPVACSLHGIDRSNIHTGDTVAIIGLGSIGQLMLQLALAAGAARVVAIEPIASKRQTALKLGACLAIDPTAQDVKKAVEEAGIESLDTVIECVGRANTMEMAVEIASNAATVMLFGLTPPETRISLLPLEQIFNKEITITGSYINPLVSQRVIDLLASAGWTWTPSSPTGAPGRGGKGLFRRQLPQPRQDSHHPVNTRFSEKGPARRKREKSVPPAAGQGPRKGTVLIYGHF